MSGSNPVVTAPRPRLPAWLQEGERERFLAAVLPNIALANDVDTWLPMMQPGRLAMPEQAATAIRHAAGGFFAAALAAVDAAMAAGTPVTVDALRAATGAKGAQFFAPLRATLTGHVHGPELGPLLAAIPVSLVRARLAAALEG